MWLLINVLLYVVSACLFAYAYKYQGKLGDDVILWMVASCIICAIASLSSMIQFGLYLISTWRL